MVVNQAQHPAVVSECLGGHGSKTKATFIEADECELPTPEGRSVLCCYLAFSFSISSSVGGNAVVDPSASGTPTSKNICSRPAGATEFREVNLCNGPPTRLHASVIHAAKRTGNLATEYNT